MNSTFDRSKKLAPLTCDEVDEILSAAAPNAFEDNGRLFYVPLHDDDVRDFLFKTTIDRNPWREAQPATDTPEMVCTSFSLLMIGLFEQERLKCHVLYPLAFGRIKLRTHSLNGYINQERRLKIVEPQNDRVYSMAEFVATYPDNRDINVITLQ